MNKNSKSEIQNPKRTPNRKNKIQNIMFLIVYNILLYFYFIFSFPFYLFKFFTSEKYRIGLRERLGFLDFSKKKKTILVHTVSVGEFLGSLTFIYELKRRFNDYDVVVSTTTVAANRIARKKIGGEVPVVFFPLDFSWAVQRFLDQISPDLVILVETELWPNFLHESRKKNIPVALVNGRISEHSYKNYRRIRFVFKKVCDFVRVWGVQFERDRNRLIDLGIETEKVVVTGSMKFDSAVQCADNFRDLDGTRKAWGWSPDSLILAGGSTHCGEEKILIDIYKELKKNYKNLILVIIPRHTERAKEVEEVVLMSGLRYVRRSNWQDDMRLKDYDVILVDTMGDLFSVYSMATVVVIGKSFVKGGGQNLLEPAALGKPVICGPLMSNFLDITLWLSENKGIIQVGNVEELKEKIMLLLGNNKERETLGNRAKELVRSRVGVVKRNVELIGKVIE